MSTDPWLSQPDVTPYPVAYADPVAQRRIEELEAERDELRAKVAEFRAALAGDGYCVCDDSTTYAKDCGIRVHREKARTRREEAE